MAVMRLILASILVMATLSGCLADDDVGDGETALGFFVFHYPAPGIMTSEDSPHPLAWAVRVANPSNDTVRYDLEAAGMAAGRGGIVTHEGWLDTEIGGARLSDTLAPGESRLWVYEGDWSVGDAFTMNAYSNGARVFTQELTAVDGGGIVVQPGMHVQTRTVGLWVNGTSFYTNIPQMLQNASFPAGGNIDRQGALADATPLPVYVYDQDRLEQPDSSIDNCYFTTIPGYNALLKTQVTGVTGARFLTPAEGYTRAGNEAHLLYGDALVFLNVVTAVVGQAGADQPDPLGACFDANRYTPDPIPDIPPTLGWL